MSDRTNKDKHQEVFEERLSRETRPPNGQRLILHSLRFAEVIQVNDFEKLEKGLDLLYEETLKNKNTYTVSSEQENYRNFIAEARRAFLSSGWVNLQGFVSKSFADSHKKGIITRPVRELPSGVESLSFFMRQIIPSSIVVVAHVQYNSGISDSLNELFTQNYSERIEKHQHGTRHIPPKRIKDETIRNFFLELQGASESFISKYFTGAFLSEKTTEAQVQCPSIRLFSLQDIPFTSTQTLITWIKEHGHFLDTFGYLPIPFLIYQFNNEYLLFRQPIYERRENPISLSLLSSESLFSAPEAHQMYGTAFSALEYKYDMAFNNLMPIIAFNCLMLWHSRRAISYRNNLDNFTTNIKSDLRKQYDSMCNAKIAINNDYFDFVRLRQELEYITSPQMEKWLYEDAAKFEPLENPKNLPHYAKDMVSNINFLTSNIGKEYSLLNERYSDLFETMNTQSSFILNESNIKYQKTLARFTKVLVGLGVVMLLAVIIQIIIGVQLK